MANTRPFTEAHAIACVDVAVIFDSEIEDLLDSSISAAVDDHLQAHKFVRKKQNKKSWVWQLLSEGGERLEEAHLHDGFMHVSSFQYRGWTNSRDLAVSRLSPVLALCRSGELTGVAQGLAIIDVFINDTGSDYEAREVFSEQSKVLSSTAFSGSGEWRQDLEWELESGAVRANLSVTAREVDEDDGEGDPNSSEDAQADGSPQRSKHVTRVALRLSSDGNFDADLSVEETFKAELNRLHQLNKSVMLDLLSGDMSKAIGLRE